jgi:hypothetical protein
MTPVPLPEGEPQILIKTCRIAFHGAVRPISTRSPNKKRPHPTLPTEAEFHLEHQIIWGVPDNVKNDPEGAGSSPKRPGRLWEIFGPADVF